MSFPGFAADAEGALPSPGSVPLGGELPVRARPPRGAGRDADADATPKELFQGCPLFPVDGANAKGESYRDRFAACGFTQDEAESGELGLRLRLESPDARTGGTSKATFGIPLLPLSTTQEAIHDRWGPGKYEVTLCRRSANDRIKSSSKSISRALTLLPRVDRDDPDGELDVGDEAWPIDAEDPNLTEAMRAEIERREEIRARDAGQPSRVAPHPPMQTHLPPMGYGPGTPFGVDAFGRPLPAPSAKPSALDALLNRFAADPLATISTLTAAAAGIKSALGADRPPAPSAQEIAAATAAAVAQAMAPALQTIAQAVAAKPAGPDPMEMVRLQMEAARADADRRLAEFRAQMEAARLQSEQQFKLQIAHQQYAMQARELELKLDAAKTASEAEKGSILKELNEVRKKLASGETESAPGMLEQLGDVLDTKFGEALAPMVAAPLGRLIDAFAGGGAPAPSAAPVAPVFAPQVAMPAPQYPAPSVAPSVSVPVPEEPAEDAGDESLEDA